MKYVIAILPLALLTAGPSFAFPVGRSVPPESFLDYHVDTVPQLTFEVAYDSAVRVRLARHFHLSGPAMSQYVSRNLVLTHLQAPLKTRVYCVTSNGHEYYVVMTLHKGAAVFTNADGKPILRLECGNPLVPVLPKPKMQALLTKPVVKTAVQSALEQQITPSMASSSVLAATSGSGVLAPVIETVGPGEALFTAAGAGGSALGWIPAIGGIFAVVATSGHSSGTPNTPVTPNTPTVPTTPTTPTIPTTPTTPSTPPAVPEPSPALVMIFGGLGLLAAVRLRRARRAR